jgi:hypothetical protein
MSPGVLLRAGMAGQIVGIDWKAAEALLPSGVDRDQVFDLLRAWETGMLEGVAEKGSDKKDG